MPDPFLFSFNSYKKHMYVPFAATVLAHSIYCAIAYALETEENELLLTAELANLAYKYKNETEIKEILRNSSQLWWRGARLLGRNEEGAAILVRARFFGRKRDFWCIAGTESIYDALIVDPTIPLGGSCSYRTAVSSYHCFYVGHSLGGYIAESLGVNYNVPYYAFNAPASTFASQEYCAKRDKIAATYINHTKDPICWVGSPFNPYPKHARIFSVWDDSYIPWPTHGIESLVTDLRAKRFMKI